MPGIKMFFAAIGILVINVSSIVAGEISGIVKDFDKDCGLAWATVQIEGTNRGARTDENGNFRITSVPAGRQTVIASMIGYTNQIKEVEVEGEISGLGFALKETPLEIGDVVVTATRTPRYLKNVPVLTEVITRKSIENKAAHNLYEALDGLPGIRVEQQCQACNFSVLRMQGLGADHTQILIDGQPVYSGLASVYGLQQIGTENIDHIEVVKGAGSALYGSNAIAGAINIISAVPRQTEGKIGIELGENNSNKYSISTGIRRDNVSAAIFAQQNQGDAIDETGDGTTRGEVKGSDGITDRVKTDSKNFGFNLYIDDPSETARLTVRGWILSEDRQGGEVTDNLYENPFSPGTERIITNRYSGEIGYWKQFESGSQFDLSFSYTDHRRNATNDTFLGDYQATHGDTLPSVDEMRPYIAEENLYVANISITRPLVSGHRLLAGIQLSRNELDESGKYVVVNEGDSNYGVPYTSYSDKKADDIGVYFQDEYLVTNGIELVGGLRFDYHKSEDNFHGSVNVLTEGVEPVKYDKSAVNPRFAVKFDAADQLTFRLNVGTGFRVPYGFSEDLHLCSGSPRVYKGSDLRPEKSYSYNISADYVLNNIDCSINLYRTELKDAISFVDAGDEVNALGYDYQWKNIDDAYVMGVELGGKFGLTKNLAFTIDLAFNKGEYDNIRDDWAGTPYEKDSRKFSRYPDLAGGVKLDFSPNHWNFIVNADYKGKMYIDYFADGQEPTKIKRTEPYVILNALVSKVIMNNYKVYVGAKNLTDYIQEEKHIDDAAFMYAPVYGRLLYAGVEISIK
jgi:outer membrane receptor for ferrienterochelin and colicins